MKPFNILRLSPEKAIFVFLSNVLPPTGEQRQGAAAYNCRPLPKPATSSSHHACLLQTSHYTIVYCAPIAFAAALMSTVWDQHRDQDGFLYVSEVKSVVLVIKLELQCAL